MKLKKQGIIQLVVDLVFLLAVGIPFFVVYWSVEPFQRGFFCDDQSIQYPYKAETVSFSVCAASFILAGIMSFLIIEVIFGRVKDMLVCDIFWNTSKVILAYLIGAGITLVLTEVGKLTIGRLRPHFMAVCDPDFSEINCFAGYITDFECLNVGGYSETIMMDAHKSFPSAHASFSVYSAFFLSIYYHQRLRVVGWSVLLKVVLQMAVATWAFFIMCSRVSDYMHHWSDVIIGGVLGLLVAIWTAIVLGRHLSFFGRTWWGKEVGSVRDVEMEFPSATRPVSQPITFRQNSPWYTMIGGQMIPSQATWANGIS